MTNLEANYNRAWNGWSRMLLRGNKRAANGYARLVVAIHNERIKQGENWT